MSELEMNDDAKTEELNEELSDEALDREAEEAKALSVFCHVCKVSDR